MSSYLVSLFAPVLKVNTDLSGLIERQYVHEILFSPNLTM